MDTERESTPKRKGFLTATRVYIAKVTKRRTKTNINARQINLEHQKNQSLTLMLTKTSSKQETVATVCSSKDKKEESDVTAKPADENAHGETGNIRLSNEYVETTPADDLGVRTSEEGARRSAQAKKDAEEKAEEKAKELKKADERLARVRNGRGYIKYNLEGSKYMVGKQNVEQLKIKCLGTGWQYGKMILVELGDDCEYIIPTPGIGDRRI
jgi:hypothetical protein